MDFPGQKAIYLQIADYICEQILLKKWDKNAKLPSVRELAINLEVNPNTVMRTYSFLEERGIIETQRGIGYFLTDKAHQQVLALKKHEFLTIDLPQVFRTMTLLDIKIADINKLYQGIKHEKE